MVCKEDILIWFKDLDSHKRIDILCELINMCLPFEVRFFGSYLEEVGNHSHQELRLQALAANDVDKLDKDPGFKNQTIFEETIRHRLLINVSLLKSRNYNVANWYSIKFLRTDFIEDMIVKEKDDLVQTELLLLYTMALRHPAFSFEHKQFYSRILLQLYELKENQFNRSCTYRYPPGFEYSNLYRNTKVQDSSQFPIGIHMHPPGLPQQMDIMGQFRGGWPGMPCGAPAEVPPFPHQSPLQPPQPSTSPLVSSPCQSRCESPRSASRPPTFTILTSTTPTVTIPTGNPTGLGPAPVLPAAITTPGAAVIATPVASVLPGMVPVPIEALGPPLPIQSSQLSPVYEQAQSGQEIENDDLNTTLKEESPHKPSAVSVNQWIGCSNTNPESKQLNGLRLHSSFPSAANVRTSIADQMQSMALTDESSHYHSSSSSSPLQTPPSTPSNLIPPTLNTTTTHRLNLDKNRINGVPGFHPPYGDATSPPPPQPTFSFPAYGPIHPHRYYTTAGFRPPVTTVFGQFAPAPNQPFQGAQPTGAESATPSYHPYSMPYISLMYSSYVPPPLTGATSNSVPPRNQPPGCYNCGAAGHLGQDCSRQNIDDITQKNTYRIEFSPVNSDSEK